VVVYKVDRLTRSVTDSAKMVERFDAHGVSFVAVNPAVQHHGFRAVCRRIANIKDSPLAGVEFELSGDFLNGQ